MVIYISSGENTTSRVVFFPGEFQGTNVRICSSDIRPIRRISGLAYVRLSGTSNYLTYACILYFKPIFYFREYNCLSVSYGSHCPEPELNIW